MIKEHQLVTIFCEIDDFCKELDKNTSQARLTGPSKGRRGPACCLSVSEIMTIQILFQMMGYRNFKTFYTCFLQQYWRQYFPKLPSYQRFVELMSLAIFPLALFAQFKCGKKTGIYYVDGSCLPVCHIKRSRRNKVFKEIAEYGRTSVGWFFGLKVHIVINHLGELIAFKMTRGSMHDSAAAKSLLLNLEGLAFGDKGYIGQKLFDELFKNGLKLITRKRNEHEKQLLNQRNLVETVFDCLKHTYHIWHTRHRSILNAMANLLAGLAAYTIEPLKLSAFKLLQQELPTVNRA
jgi:hypothetical protein